MLTSMVSTGCESVCIGIHLQGLGTQVCDRSCSACRLTHAHAHARRFAIAARVREENMHESRMMKH